MSNNSSEESSSTDYTTDSSDDDGMETAQIDDSRLQLPQALCERQDIFREFFNADLWNSMSDANKQHLQTFLPNFPENDELEKGRTLQKLFDGEVFRFHSPLLKFHEDLKAGYFRPDIARMRKIIQRAEHKEAKYRYRSFRNQLKQEVIESQRKLLDQIRNLPPGVEPKTQKRKPTVDYVAHRTKRRYFQILAAIRAKAADEEGATNNDCSSDENYPEGPPVALSRKQKRHLNSVRNSLTGNKELRYFQSTMATNLAIDLERYITPNYNPFYINDEAYRNLMQQHRKRKMENPDDLELCTRGITISDIIQRTQLPYLKNITTTSHQSKAEHNKLEKIDSKSSRKRKRDSSLFQNTFTGKLNRSSISDSDSDTTTTTTDTVLSKSAKSRLKKTRTPTPKKEKVIKEEPIIDVVSTTPPVITNAISPKVNVVSPKFPSKTISSPKATSNSPKMTAKTPNTSSSSPKLIANSPKVASMVPKLSSSSPKGSLKSSNSSNLIPTLVSSSSNSISLPVPSSPIVVNNNLNIKEINSLTQLSQYGKITPAKVEDLEGIDMMNLPIVDLANPEIDILELSKPELMQETHSNFFALIRDVICSTSEHRMNMYTLQERLKLWQENPISPLNDWYHLSDNWIGLLPSAITFLCGNSSEQPDDFVPYMEYKTTVDSYQWIGAGRDSDSLLSNLCSFWLDHRSDNKQQVSVIKKEIEEVEVDVVDRVQTPPPPRCPTNWTVRKATPEEIKDFREQERRRYANPHKAFTYRCNGYESVVGPLKGIYNAAVLGNNTKARGHTMLNADRPNFVTILSLVRDATARLPNGEGTRSDICELLKSSQYISSTAPDNVLQSVVSGALDRMHTQFDPCVKYDPKRKIWIYLHRNRTEEDFERIHQQYQGMNKNVKKGGSKKSPKASKPRAKKIENDKVAAAVAAVTAIAPQSIQDIKKANVSVIATASNSPVAKGTSLLISNANLVNANNLITNTTTANLISSEMTPTLTSISDNTKTKTLLVDKDATIQTIVQTTSARSSPTIKGGKSLVKILAPGQGKSLIIPTTNAQLIKQIQQSQSPTKQINQTMTQQLLQNIVAQQKQILAQQKLAQSTVVVTEVASKLTVVSAGDNLNTVDTSTTSSTAITAPQSEGKIKVQSQHIIHPITPQQLQNIKNVTLLRGPNQLAGASDAGQSNIVTVAVSKAPESAQQHQQQPQLQPSVQIKTHGNLTPAQQQQILQTIKQKILPQTNVLQSQQQQQQIILKQQKGGAVPPKLAGTSILTNQQSKLGEATAKVVAGNQGPVVAKVVTNAAGQVISVESLLAHQKQHGSLPQGTTLRVATSKAGQQNIIHLTGSSKPNTITQFAVASQNSLIALASQPKLVVTSPTTTTTTVTSTKSTSQQRTANKPQSVAKFTPKVAQQLINAKIITQNLDGQKLVQPKLVMSQQQTNQSKLSPVKATPLGKPVTLSVGGATGANTIRMVNAANLNLTHIAGKPVLLASKGGTLQNIQGQNIVLQAPNSSGASLVLQPGTVKNANTATITSTNSINLLNQQNIVFGPQVKVQQPQMVFSTQSGSPTTKTGVSTASASQTISQAQHLVIGGHPVRLQTSNASNNTQRVVLASQGQGGQLLTQQFLLPAGFQGTAINIKALQGVKVIPIGQAGPQAKGGRPVFARVMSPGIIKTQHIGASVASSSAPTTSTPPPASLVEISKNSPTDTASSSN